MNEKETISYIINTSKNIAIFYKTALQIKVI